MWFPNNKPATRGDVATGTKPQPNNNTTHVVTTRFPTPGTAGRVRTQGYGGHSVGETPGPIPNPEAKTHSADGTAPGRVWESRSPPEHHSGRGPPTTLGVLPHLTPKHHRGTRPTRAQPGAAHRGNLLPWIQARSSRASPPRAISRS